MMIKICGITRTEDAILAVEEGASMIGFVFAESPRRISPGRAVDILEELERRSLRTKVRVAGVFVNEEPSVIEEIHSIGAIDVAQIHGDESAAFCNALHVPWYRGLRVNERFSADEFCETVHALSCAEILVDAKVEGLYGGSGHRVPVETAAVCRDIVRGEKKLFYLAGGVTPCNVRDIIRDLNPDGIDLSSSLEEARGKKSHEKIKELFRSIRGR